MVVRKKKCKSMTPQVKIYLLFRLENQEFDAARVLGTAVVLAAGLSDLKRQTLRHMPQGL